MTKRKVKKVLIAILLCLFSIALIIDLLLHVFILYATSDFFGLNKITAKEHRDGTYTVTLRCAVFSGYSVEEVAPDSEIIRGERPVPLNDDLGDYVVKVHFNDRVFSSYFMGTYSTWTTYQIENSEVSFMLAYVNDNCIYDIYIGADTPLDIDSVKVKGVQLQNR